MYWAENSHTRVEVWCDGYSMWFITIRDNSCSKQGTVSVLNASCRANMWVSGILLGGRNPCQLFLAASTVPWLLLLLVFATCHCAVMRGTRTGAKFQNDIKSILASPTSSHHVHYNQGTSPESEQQDSILRNPVARFHGSGHIPCGHSISFSYVSYTVYKCIKILMQYPIDTVGNVLSMLNKWRPTLSLLMSRNMRPSTPSLSQWTMLEALSQKPSTPTIDSTTSCQYLHSWTRMLNDTQIMMPLQCIEPNGRQSKRVHKVADYHCRLQSVRIRGAPGKRNLPC